MSDTETAPALSLRPFAEKQQQLIGALLKMRCFGKDERIKADFLQNAGKIFDVCGAPVRVHCLTASCFISHVN